MITSRWDQLTAETYDTWTARFQSVRELVVDVLPLDEGDVVADVGCGTGLLFARLAEAVGRTGRVIGIDASADMLEQAQHRIEQHRWSQVSLLHAPASEAHLPQPADAAVFCAVHDVLQDESSIDNVLGQLRPRAWVSAVGGQWVHPSVPVLDLLIFWLHAPYVTDFRHFDRPWQLLSRHLDGWQVYDVAAGTGFLLVGRTSRPPVCPVPAVPALSGAG
jgi:demethylmenaquinone methyltransferase/2-methoxy-6-polyprenyl-1,4-benzoquinol methylase